ncbi:uncharacterized protein V1513DRAFT_399796 [Lipomyces chichibuensis]|uniref:uncharacterized protein n=1 Tax=Lipomyces chichibuensis TaxID=1546026 RepID=UPI00334337B3
MNSKRVLVLGPPKSGKFTFLKELTGSTPTLSADSTVGETSAETTTEQRRPTHAGLSHTLSLPTKYFETEVPIWIDEYDDTSDETGIRGWATSFSSADAHEVVSALGAIIYTFRKPETRDEYVNVKSRVEREIRIIHDMLISHYKSQNMDDHFEELIDWDGISLAVAIPSATAKTLSSDDKDEESIELDPEEWETLLQPFGFEFIDIQKTGRNDYGELLGLERVKEALETYSWDASDEAARARQRGILEGYDEYDTDERHHGFGYDDDELDSDGFDQELREMQLEMAALHFAMDSSSQQRDHTEEQDGEVGEPKPLPESNIDELEQIMLRMKQVKERGEGLPLEERKKLADELAEDLLRLL